MYCLLVLYAFIFWSSFLHFICFSFYLFVKSWAARNSATRDNDNVTMTTWHQQCDNNNVKTCYCYGFCDTSSMSKLTKTATRLLATICWSHWSRCCGSCRKYCPALYNLFSMFHFSSSMSTCPYSPILLFYVLFIYSILLSVFIY